MHACVGAVGLGSGWLISALHRISVSILAYALYI